MAVDVVEPVRLRQANEADVIDRWRRFVNDVRIAVLPRNGGRLVKSLGDGQLLEFASVTEAVQCAIAIQRLSDSAIHRFNATRDTGLSAERRRSLQIGAHVADLIVDDLDIYGTGVNLAAGIASLAAPGEIVASGGGWTSQGGGLGALSNKPQFIGKLEDIGGLHRARPNTRCCGVATRRHRSRRWTERSRACRSNAVGARP